MQMQDGISQKRISILYMSALSFVAILSTLSFYTLSKSLEASSSTAYIVNISGKQRMLSQHIALDLHRIHNALEGHKSVYNVALTQETLLAHTKSMHSANEILSSGRLPNGKKITLSATIYAMYFGDMNIKERVDTYINIANKITKAKDKNETHAIMRSIDMLSERLLVDLNKVVHQYQLEGEEKLQSLQNMEIIAWVLVLFTLLLEIIFIFQPIMKKLLYLIAEKTHILENLEYEVQLRTLSLKEANYKLHEMASHDPMTGLRNRLTLENDIKKAIQHYEENHAPFAVLMLDIDWFKDVNDTYGHDIGDRVIKEISEKLLSSVREGDKVYRAGGEEFVVLLNRISFEDTQKIAQKIRLLIEEWTFHADKEEFHKTISIGLYHSDINGVKNSTELLKRVDNALYSSKENGRNRITNVSGSKQA